VDNYILNLLKENIDKEYANFQSKLIPNIESTTVLGVRTPILRSIAKKLAGSDEAEVFMNSLPHKYFEENQLHAFIISEIKDATVCIQRYTEFVPYINNWATCDQLVPKVFKKHPEYALELVPGYLQSDETYTIRTGIGILMRYYLDELFEERFLGMVEEVSSEEYYVNMMRAWYFATALAKQYDATVRIVESGSLDKWTHNKTIQKAVESYRITDEQKQYLKSLRLK